MRVFICVFVCLFALFLYLRACACSIFISSPCMSLTVMHISSFKCRLSGNIKFKISKTHWFDVLAHMLTNTHTQMPSLYFQPCKYIAFYTWVWGAIGLLAGKTKQGCVLIDIKASCFSLVQCTVDRLRDDLMSVDRDPDSPDPLHQNTKGLPESHYTEVYLDNSSSCRRI